MSWEEREVRSEASAIAAFMLEAIMTDDEAFVLANRHISSTEQADQLGNVDEAAAKQQKLTGFLREWCKSTALSKKAVSSSYPGLEGVDCMDEMS